ncbi:MAG: arsenite methyltransferase [Bacteroidales bacterium]|nr:arsenite methyltransferase [Bacteroidales bacterium]
MEKIKKNIKDIVKDKYGKIAEQSKQQNASSCCGSGTCCGEDYTVFNDNYDSIEGYNPEADLGLGCGLPTEFADIKRGNTVLDLGSGAGNDCFIARAAVGKEGKVIGLDFTEKMLEKAKVNVSKLGYQNVEFIKGDIEDMPIKSDTIDVVISNCVLNLVPDKKKAFSEIYRVLKPKAHFCVSDVVILGDLPENIRKDAEMYAGCISGAVKKDEYLDIIVNTGFKNVKVRKEKEIILPANLLMQYLTDKDMEDFKLKKLGIYSVTVFAEK